MTRGLPKTRGAVLPKFELASANARRFLAGGSSSPDPYPPAQLVPHRGHLLFGLDLTSSRAGSIEAARIATSEMLHTMGSIGSLTVKVAFYRGEEFQVSAWLNDPFTVNEYMKTLQCVRGYSQIGNILRFALNEPEGLDGVIFIGDQCEEDHGELTSLAASLGRRKIPLYIFHEVSRQEGYTSLSVEAIPLFKLLARVTNGVYTELSASSGATLRELLATVGAFSAAAHEGLRQLASTTRTPEARQLQKTMLMLPAPGRKEAR